MQEVIKINEIEKRRYLLVKGPSFEFLPEEVRIVKEKVVAEFTGFQPNPVYENIVNGIKVFNENCCDAIIAVGGGSAIDVAKCIKYASMADYFGEIISPKEIPVIVVPTTAGTGSESTHFAVVYKNGIKQSISEGKLLPNKIIFCNEVLKTLPLYQKKSTMLDALCHAMESYWSINSCEESRSYAFLSISIILEHYCEYLSGEEKTFEKMFYASNLSGKAINITTTTAGHAMSYKLASLKGITHGHAVALVVEKLYPFMLEHIDKCESEAVKNNLLQLGNIITPEQFSSIIKEMNFRKVYANDEDFEVLGNSVNIQRLKNNPIQFDLEEIDDLYHQILRDEKNESGKTIKNN